MSVLHFKDSPIKLHGSGEALWLEEFLETGNSQIMHSAQFLFVTGILRVDTKPPNLQFLLGSFCLLIHCLGVELLLNVTFIILVLS